MIIRLLTVGLILLIGCTPIPRKIDKPHSVAVSTHSIELADSKLVKKLLRQQFKDWRSVKYQTGGLSKEGVDCSGFVYVTYVSKFGINIPRDTASQLRTGRTIPRNRLRPGDLVFFKTGFYTRHVGIYYDDQKFMHASQSKGVMISSLEDRYWIKSYWKSVRINR
jgi:cell wall-associated NlpC family hydrolase